MLNRTAILARNALLAMGMKHDAMVVEGGSSCRVEHTAAACRSLPMQNQIRDLYRITRVCKKAKPSSFRLVKTMNTLAFLFYFDDSISADVFAANLNNCKFYSCVSRSKHYV